MTDLQTEDCVRPSNVTLVGSRDVAEEVSCQLIPHVLRITKYLTDNNIEGISGAAPGMDSVWYKAYCHFGRDDLFTQVLPWNTFQGFTKQDKNIVLLDDWMSLYAEHTLLSSGVLWYHKLSEGIRKLYRRNVYQVVLPDYSMTDAVFYYCKTTKTGQPTGGTAIAVRIAKAFNIPTFNLGLPSELKAAYDYLGLDYVL